MKPAFLFFLCFGFLLLSGSNHVCLPVSLQSSHAILSNCTKEQQQVQPVFQSKNNSIYSTDASGEETDFSNAVEPEDNDDDYKLSAKLLQWSNCFLPLIQWQLSGDVHRYRKDRLPACPHFALLASDKFITYRVIRI